MCERKHAFFVQLLPTWLLLLGDHWGLEAECTESFDHLLLFRERTNSWQPCLQERGLHDLSTWTSGMSASPCAMPGASYAHDWPPRPVLRGSQHTHRAGCPRFGFFIFISAPTKFQPGGRKPNRASLNIMNKSFHHASYCPIWAADGSTPYMYWYTARQRRLRRPSAAARRLQPRCRGGRLACLRRRAQPSAAHTTHQAGCPRFGFSFRRPNQISTRLTKTESGQSDQRS